jgi:hypothetical protein
MITYDRYNKFKSNGKISIVPFIEIPVKTTDYYEKYKRGQTRLDILSYQYYNNPNYGWLILQANPEYGSMEFSIPDNSELRIPYPLSVTLEQYKALTDRYIDMYGIG